MPAPPRPVSLIAERAVRLLREREEPLSSRELARALLATSTADERAATDILQAAFGADERLLYTNGVWSAGRGGPRETDVPLAAEPDRTFLLLRGGRAARGAPFVLERIEALRYHDHQVVESCGGAPTGGRAGDLLRRRLRAMLQDSVAVLHDAPGALAALERFLDEPLEAPISLRRLGQTRRDLPARHELSTLLGQLGLDWRECDDPVETADALADGLAALMKPGETLADVGTELWGSDAPIDWSRFEFDRDFLRAVPHAPGTYCFFDEDGELLYVGKSKDLHRRLWSYFRPQTKRSRRRQRIVERLRRIEYDVLQSELEALLREAQLIRREAPTQNVQRKVHGQERRRGKLRSILILEPAAAPLILRAYLIRDGQLMDKTGIGPRGGGLTRIERVLEDHFFSVPVGPTPQPGPRIDVELVTRWLAANRDRAVAFDPTDLPNAREVIDRLRYFIGRGGTVDPDGTPVIRR